ncbi:MAG: response regulator transcription factor [Ruminococcus sp.]|nr:response regulator transcription factor [Ruminococcus sp.]
MYNVIIVEDSKLSRTAIEHQLAGEPDLNIVTSIESAANADILCMRGNIDLVIMDICTANDESGLVAAARIKSHYPHIKIVIMTSMPEYSFIKKARESGCESFWYKEYGSMDIAEVCRRTMAGESVWPEELPQLTIGLAKGSDFTDRELEVIRELVGGHKYSEIAVRLNVTENTVKFHIKSIMQKTGYKNTLQLVADVVEKKFIMPKY